MLIGYIDESGCTGTLPSASSQIQPVFVLAAICIEHDMLLSLTNDFLDWKRKFFKKLISNHKTNHSSLDHILIEIKGADLRKKIRGNTKQRKFALTAIDHLLNIIEKHQENIIGNIRIKPVGKQFNGTSVYTSSIQNIANHFNVLCGSTSKIGMLIADSRNKQKNERVSHSIFTKMFKISDNSYANITEMPTFGHSGNHAGIQIADLICSAVLFPMATFVYCSKHMTDRTHIYTEYAHIINSFGSRIMKLQYRYQDTTGKWCGGITVSDPQGKQHGGILFKKVTEY
ncbi:MAG: DUF3800 domain-containing protein [Magnetococcus sp. DMHC-1]